MPSDELFQWWSDRVGSTDLALYGRKLWEAMSSHWPTADQQPGVTPAQIEFARRWRDMPKVVFSSTISAVGWNARLVTGDAVTEITRLKKEDGGPMDVVGATLALYTPDLRSVIGLDRDANRRWRVATGDQGGLRDLAVLGDRLLVYAGREALLVAPDSGHEVMRTRPSIFNAALADFYRSTEAVARERATSQPAAGGARP